MPQCHCCQRFIPRGNVCPECRRNGASAYGKKCRDHPHEELPGDRITSLKKQFEKLEKMLLALDVKLKKLEVRVDSLDGKVAPVPVEKKQDGQPSRRKCGKCGKPGHYAKTCPN